MARHRLLAADLKTAEFNGLVISFDWPCANSTLNYYEDRSDAAKTAKLLVDRGIRLLAEGQAQDCVTNIHLLGHSTGAYVIAEAFAQSDKVGDLFKRDWRVDQIGLIGGDISAKSLGLEDPMKAVFDRCVRLTNYSSGHDYVLAISNAKRLGASPRCGRVGAPKPAHPKVVNVDCTSFFETLNPQQERFEGTFAHSWHIGNKTWALDWAMAMIGGSDRGAFPTRRAAPGGGLELQVGDWPEQWDLWAMERNRG
jgi:esterase/lipase superfamily enzyme